MLFRSATRFSQANGQEAMPAIAAAEAFVDLPPWAPGATALPLQAGDGAFDSRVETVGGVIDTTGLASGRHLVYVRGVNTKGRDGPVSAVFLDIL